MFKLASSISFLAMVAGILGLILRRELLHPLPWLIAVQAGAVLLMFWARVTFGMGSFHLAADPTEDKLITSGPYRWIRHPIYAAVIFFTLPPAVVSAQAPSLALAALILLGAIIRMLCEEHLLIRRFPEYREYASKTRRLIPWVF